MILKAIIEDQIYTLNVPDAVLQGGEEVFARLDSDMDKGWQMSREWEASPDRLQRCQIVANKLLTALENGNEKLGMLMAGYILSRLPNVESVEPDIRGEMQNTLFHFRDEAGADQVPATPHSSSAGTDKIAAMAQAGNDVTKVFKVGKGYRFSVRNQATDQWQDSQLIANEDEAERMRQEAFKQRFDALLRGKD